jgi:hypothetical protein
MRSSVSIVIGRSNHTNGMIFWDPITQRMNVSTDYKLDPNACIGIHFPTVIYDGQISPMVLRRGSNADKEPFPPGLDVQIELEGEYYKGAVKSVPLGATIPNYQASISDSMESVEVPLTRITAPDKPVFPLVKADTDKTSNNSIPSIPSWLQEDTHLTMITDGSHRCGIPSSTNAGTHR